jgi:hypothetical protein
MTDNPLPDFWLHVGNAFEAGEDVDNFDPDGSEKDDMKLIELTGKANEAAVELIEFISEHKGKLLEKLKGEG